MFYQSLYRKYRPSRFDEVYGQDVAKKILINSINNDRISHAYLFFGPRGTGKTSIAKMFSRIINCLNIKNGECCEKCENCINSKDKNCIDIIEIDAASNNGVDEIRELKNKINLVPNTLKYKVYIIDEVHMLSTGAFNALLKTLEEPPEHVVFILATTEIYKVPSTIVSRCQTIEFKKIDNNSIFERLRKISKKENIIISDEAIKEIARNSNGGMRDAIGILDKAFSYVDSNINVDDVKSVLGLITENEVDEFVSALLEGNINFLLKKVDEYSDSGKDLFKILNDVILKIKNMIILDEKYELIETMNKMNEYHTKMKFSHNPEIIFQMLILDLNIEKNKTNVRKNISREIIPEKETGEKKEMKKNTLSTYMVNARKNNSFVNADKNILNEIKQKWKILNKYIFDKNIGAIICDLDDSMPVVCSKNNLMICTEYPSSSNKINENVEIYEDVLLKKLKINQKLIAVDRNEWNDLKTEYLKKLKNNEKYEYISENEVKVEKKIKQNDIIDKAKDLFGELIIN
ncbi:MAG: DNA polymerase III subunit gamma/tau [Bacilli bacterium]